jgi:hypothetical protein
LRESCANTFKGLGLGFRLAYVSIRQHTHAYVSIRQHTHAPRRLRSALRESCANTFKSTTRSRLEAETEADAEAEAEAEADAEAETEAEAEGLVAAREYAAYTHTSAYVSIRQHTSAYVSIRGGGGAGRSQRVRCLYAYVSIRAGVSICTFVRMLTHADVC